MTTPRGRVFLALLCVLMLHVPASGSTTAARLEDLIRTLLEAGPGGDAIAYRITMAQGRDGAIIATLSDISLPDAPTPLAVDDIAITWRPAGGGLYSASMMIPAVSALDDEGHKVARFSASGTLDVLVDIDTGDLESAAIDASDVTLSLAGGAATVRIDHLAASVTPQETAPATPEGQAEISVDGLAVAAGDGATVTLARGHATTRFHDIPATPDQAVLAEGASLGGRVFLEGLAGVSGSGVRGAMDLSLLEFTVSGTGGNLGAIALRYSHEGLTLEDAGLEPVMPRSLAGDVNLDAVPVAGLPAAFALPFGSAVPEGATLGLDVDWTWPDGSGSISGHLASAQRAPVPATGTVKIVTTGMADLVKNVMAAAGTGNLQARRLVTYLALFRAMGRHDGTAAEPRLVHDIVLEPDNRILVNDNDINVLLGLLNAD